MSLVLMFMGILLSGAGAIADDGTELYALAAGHFAFAAAINTMKE